MGDAAVMEVIRCCQEGERYYNEGTADEAIHSFKTALETAKSMNDRKLENECSHNLASVYAANGNRENWEQIQKDLSYQFIDDDWLAEANSITYLDAVVNKSPWHYEQALGADNDNRKQIYLLEQLVKHSKDDKDRSKQIEYLEQLQTVYKFQRKDIRYLEVACRRARLLFLEQKTEASLKVLHEVKMELDEYDAESINGRTSRVKRPMRKGTQEKSCLVPLWNEVGLMYTMLTKKDKALQSFENGLKLIHDKTAASMLKTAVLKQNIGAIRNMKDDFALAEKFHREAIQQYADYAEAIKGRTSKGKSLLKRRTQKKNCLENEKGQMHKLPTDNRGLELIHETLKDNEEAAAGVARSYLNLGYGHAKLGQIMDAQGAYTQACESASEAGDRRTMMQACEALASVSMRHSDTRVARKYLQKAMRFFMLIDDLEMVPVAGAGRLERDFSDSQRIAEKLSKLTGDFHDSHDS